MLLMVELKNQQTIGVFLKIHTGMVEKVEIVVDDCSNQCIQRIAKSVAIFAKAKIRAPFVNR